MKRDRQEREFIEAYDRYADPLFRYCYFRVRDREVAKELMQETFTKTWAYLQSGKRVDNLRAFLYRVAHNASVDEQVRKKPESLDVLREEAGYDPADEQGSSPAQAAEHSMLMRHLDGLDADSRETLMLRYMNGLPVKEIASLRDEEPNAVSVRIHRALKLLKDKMQIP
jgi:RNA polymerase sigma-70 factor (ECF subfamily)